MKLLTLIWKKCNTSMKILSTDLKPAHKTDEEAFGPLTWYFLFKIYYRNASMWSAYIYIYIYLIAKSFLWKPVKKIWKSGKNSTVAAKKTIFPAKIVFLHYFKIISELESWKMILNVDFTRLYQYLKRNLTIQIHFCL